MENKTTDIKSFHYLENGEIDFSILDTIKTQKQLDKGSYTVSYIGHPQYRVKLKKDEEYETCKNHLFPDKRKVDNLVNSFFENKTIESIKKIGFTHKTGVLFYGKEGTGKSTIIKNYYNQFIENNNAVVFHINTSNEMLFEIWNFVISIRAIQENPIVVIFDEFDDQMKHNESLIKKILDGSLSIDKSIFFASTNYIDKIPEAIKDRPSRFKYCLCIEGIQEENDVFDIIKNSIGHIYNDKDIRHFSKEIVGQTLDYIKHFCLDKIMEINSEYKTKKIGFK